MSFRDFSVVFGQSQVFHEAAAKLGLCSWQLKGLLFELWHVGYYYDMEIGRESNKQIALEIEYKGDIDALIEALLELGYLQASDDPEVRFTLLDPDEALM